jgi:hypothetical protein
MYFVFVHEYRTLKLVEIVLRRGGRGMAENNGGGECN